MAKAKLEQFLSSKHGLLLVGFIVGVGATLIGIRGYQSFSHSQSRLPATELVQKTIEVNLFAVQIANLDSPNEFVRSDAAKFLGGLGPYADEAVPKLIDLLKDTATWVPADAAKALGRIGSAEAIPALIEASNHPNGWVQAAATEALGRIRPVSSEAVAALAHAWLDDDAWVRSFAADALMAMGPGIATEAVPTFIKFLQDTKKWDWPQDIACKVLSTIGTDETIPKLNELMRQRNLHIFVRPYVEKVIAAIAARTGT